MGFLDNSGNIILDAVLTDEGRRRLALGNGQFRISKFALADDEIDYSLYTAVTASGYQDLRILKLPVFEAFTNNVSSVKNKLLNYTDNTLLYLPVINLNTNVEGGTTAGGNGPIGGYYVSVDTSTTEKIKLESPRAASNGYRYANEGAPMAETRLVFDQGLDTGDLSLGLLTGQNANAQYAQLVERSYMVEVDNRFLSITPTVDVAAQALPVSVSEDNVASYLLPLGADSNYFAKQTGGDVGGRAQPDYSITNTNAGDRSQGKAIGQTDTTGRLGSRLVFGLRASPSLQLSNNFFDTLGTTTTPSDIGVSFRSIQTVIRVTGVNTGFRVEVPITLLKYTT